MKTNAQSVFRVLGLLVAGWAWQTASAVDVAWTSRLGSATDITSHASGLVWVLGTDGPSGSYLYNVYKWDGKSFVKQSVLPARAIAVTSTDHLWYIAQGNQLYDQPPGTTNAVATGTALDVAVGGDNSVWIVGTDQSTGGYSVYKYNAGNWTAAGIGAKRIAVDKGGNPWVVNDSGEIYTYSLSSKTWVRKTGPVARSIYAGATSGAVWILGTTGIPGGYPIYQWNPATSAWDAYGTYGAVEMTEAAGVPWMVQSFGDVYSKTQPVAVSTTVDTTPQPWPAPTAQVPPPLHAGATGKLLCSDSHSDDCGYSKADYVGKHTLDTSCDTGFYDPIYGGSCWKCPDDDGRGAWIRSLDAVDKDTACWRSPKEATGSATKVKSPAWSWQCPSGSFWDGYSPDGAGGSCWTCPAELPRRTAAPVYASNACASSLNETSRAAFLTYNGCPKPDASTMDLAGQRSPGKPFLDVGAGGCFSCPITDETGNFLITDRNANPVYDKTSNNGCTVKLKWQPAPFYEPGLAYMQGVKDVIWEQKLFDGDRITGLLYDLAQSQGLGDATPAAATWVTARWQEVATSPYNSQPLRSFLFAYLKSALKKSPADRTPAELALIKSFAGYVQQRRTYLAQQALGMYDAWKAADDLYRQQTGQSASLSSLFYYGTVPLDFHGTLSNLMAVGGAGGGAIGSLISANQFAKGVQTATLGTKTFVTRESTLYGLTDELKLLKSAQGLTAVSGATVIEVAFAILSSVAIDQFVAIETARPKLEASLAEAQQPVDLDVLEKSANGEDMLYLYWSRAMETTDPEDYQVLQLAAVAQARAAQKGYAAPAKQTYNVSGDAIVSDTLRSGTTTSGYLNQNERLLSKNGQYEAIMQSDGNFVVYGANKRFIWNTGINSHGTAPYRLAMQTNGFVALYGADGILWAATKPRSGVAPYKLIMQDDGNLCVYDSKGAFIWESGTAGR